jgi:uncharacterized protein DUF4287
MSFQAYLDNIHAKTGKSPDDFVELARDRGLLEPGVKAQHILDWLNEDVELRRGHGMAIVKLLKECG